MKIRKLWGVAVVCLAVIMLIGCGKAEEKQEPKVEAVAAVDHVPAAEEIGLETTCAICGMTMTVTADMPAVTYAGKVYYFCTAEEKADFVADPDQYLMPAEEAEPKY